MSPVAELRVPGRHITPHALREHVRTLADTRPDFVVVQEIHTDPVELLYAGDELDRVVRDAAEQGQADYGQADDERLALSAGLHGVCAHSGVSDVRMVSAAGQGANGFPVGVHVWGRRVIRGRFEVKTSSRTRDFQ